MSNRHAAPEARAAGVDCAIGGNMAQASFDACFLSLHIGLYSGARLAPG